VEALLAPIEEISKIQHLDVEPQIRGGGYRNYRTKRRYRTTGFFVDWDYSTMLGDINV
jgi:hypothetical protein